MSLYRPSLFLFLLLIVRPSVVRAADAQNERAKVKQAMAQRPRDPWPRGIGHVVYAWPGSREINKGYEEPGGSFSPAVGSFGLSFWVLGADGTVLYTSDSIPLEEVSQHFAWVAGHPLPSIVVETPYYTATWLLRRPGNFVLHLRTKQSAQVAIAVRSVGPAGGPIESFRGSAHHLSINSKWDLDFSAGLSLRAMGHEGDSGWTSLRNKDTEWHGSDGWGFAVFTAMPEGDQVVTISAATPVGLTPLRFETVAPTLDLHLPDPVFGASLKAQTAHLMMGLVGLETRPGEPTNYPLAWLRDGAYGVVALAHAGQIDVAKQLARYFADHDFFGGFGPEADAPGVSLWAIGQVSLLARDPAFDASVWLGVRRKVDWIERMRRAKTPIRIKPFGPIVAAHAKNPDLDLVAEAARDGLVVGRMDWGRPLLYVNAVSYAGIMDAAGVAERLGHSQEAREWREEAFSIKTAWERALTTNEHENERTYISALWPTWVGVDSIGVFSPLLDERWRNLHDAVGAYHTLPLWTYFEVADAHQWLLLGRPDRTWQTLSWFFNHQAATGLFTWWEGSGEENNFGRWKNVRGWINPPNVTPHYWTASEMLMLELDMLAYVDQTRLSTIVIGGGVPAEWVTSNLDVRGVQTGLGVIDWSWSGGKLRAVVRKGHPRVVAGNVFGPAVQVDVSYIN